jgi:hypothetical protein
MSKIVTKMIASIENASVYAIGADQFVIIIIESFALLMDN